MAVSRRKQLRKVISWMCVAVSCGVAAQRVLFPLYSNTQELQHSQNVSSRRVGERDITNTSGARAVSAANKPLEMKFNQTQQGQAVLTGASLGIYLKEHNISLKGLGLTPKQKRRLFSANGGNFLLGGKDLTTSQTLYKEVSNDEIDKLTMILGQKLENLPASGIIPVGKTCNSTAETGNSCDQSGCLQLQLPKKLRTRIEQIVKPAHLRVGEDIKVIISKMSAQIPKPKDVILIVSGASSSHYLESLSLLDNLHNHLLPHLKNFTLLYFDVGLDPPHRQHIASICKCALLDFPFQLLFDLVSLLKCYSWKPLIVSAAIQRAELVFWVDASITFRPDPAHALSLLRKARHRVLQMGLSPHSTISYTTVRRMFHFKSVTRRVRMHLTTNVSVEWSSTTTTIWSNGQFWSHG